MRVAGKEGLYHKLVFEVRYQHGMVYLDRCGTTANRIMRTYPEWVLQDGSANPQNAPLIHTSTGIQFNFGALKYDFSMDQPTNQAVLQSDIDTFVDQVAALSAIVHEELELSSFIREGFRVWYIFDMASEDEANQWIRNLRPFNIESSLADAFGGTLEAVGYTSIINTSERKYRISVNTVERLERLDVGNLSILPRSLPRKQREALLEQMRAKKRLRLNPHYAAAIDVDAYIDEPIDVVPQDFITQSLSVIEEKLPSAIQRR